MIIDRKNPKVISDGQFKGHWGEEWARYCWCGPLVEPSQDGDRAVILHAETDALRRAFGDGAQEVHGKLKLLIEKGERLE